MTLPKDVQAYDSTLIDTRRNRVAARLANLSLRIATPLYRDFINGSIRYGIQAAVKAVEERPELSREQADDLADLFLEALVGVFDRPESEAVREAEELSDVAVAWLKRQDVVR